MRACPPPCSRLLPSRFGFVASTLVLLASSFFRVAQSEEPDRDRETVGHKTGGRAVTPVNQAITPYGEQFEFPGLRPQALALSPDGRRVLISGKTDEVIVLDAASGKILQRVGLASENRVDPASKAASTNYLVPDNKGLVSYTGLVFTPDGKRVFLSNVHGNLKMFETAEDGSLAKPVSVPLPPANAPARKPEIPAGLAFSHDGQRLYVCGNLSNRLLELDARSGEVLRTFPVGVAPFDVVVVGRKAYVSNWGGRRPEPGDVTGPAGRGMQVRVDPVRHIACEGSVSVIDLREGKPEATKELIVGLHPSALAVSPNGRYVVCANSASDTLSVVEVKSDKVVETIWAKINPADLFGASPNALVFSPDGHTLYAANGTQNAVAVFDFDPSDNASRLAGMIPVGWFPGALAFDAERKQLWVANIKGLPSTPKTSAQKVPAWNSHHYNGTVSRVPLPSKKQLPALSEQVARNLRSDALAASRLPARPGMAPRPIPERIGEPSVFKHVVYILKENRTYDQVLGDDPRGNGMAPLCVFGEEITPNQHKLVREFVLLDNTYCSGILSADGHQWSTSAFATAAMERSFAGFPRSYPDGMGEGEKDALIYSPAGFLWDNALKHGRTLRNYGEFAQPEVRWSDPSRKGRPGFEACYKAWKEHTHEVAFGCAATIESLVPHTASDTVGWNMAVPDQFRADYFIRELRAAEKTGKWPELMLVCLPQDHTSGTSPGTPTPAACVADNDLAFGRMVEAVSKSRFWAETLILAIEDDPQAGWDHVSGYRTTAYCVSAYTRRGAVVSTQYNTTSILRTIEQVLGLPPMNQFDASATPMRDCFQDTANLTPFTAVPNRVPLDQLNPPAKAQLNRTLRRNAELSAKMDFQQVDKAPEAVLNRVLWQAMAGTERPYPQWAVTRVAGDGDDDDDVKRVPFWKRLLRIKS
jgi:YVTN family beta-propeller protein